MPSKHRLILTSNVVVEPATEPVSLSDMKDHLIYTESDKDAYISGLIRSARLGCEQYTARALITQEHHVWLDAWPMRHVDRWWDGVREGAMSELVGTANQIELPRPPLQSVSHIITYDDNDVSTPFLNSNIFVDTDHTPGRIVLRTGVSAPTTTRVANGIEIHFVCGYGDAADAVPDQLTHGIRMMVAWMFENRGDSPEVAARTSGAETTWDDLRIRRL